MGDIQIHYSLLSRQDGHRSNGTIELGEVPNSLIEPTAAKGKVLALMQILSSANPADE